MSDDYTDCSHRAAKLGTMTMSVYLFIFYNPARGIAIEVRTDIARALFVIIPVLLNLGHKKTISLR